MNKTKDTLRKKLLFIYNPCSGKGNLKNWLADIIDILSWAGYEVTVYPTQCAKDATRRVEQGVSEFDLVICSGGDGTLDEVVNGIIKGDVKTSLGYIPAGTVNDFARSLNISTDIITATNNIISGEDFKCDVGSFNEEYFTYVAAFGLFTSVPFTTEQTLKNTLGKLAYFLEGVKQITELPSYRLRIEGDTFTVTDEYLFGMVTNSSSVAGIKTKLLNTSEFDDGLFEVTLVKMPKTLAEMNEIAKVLLTGDTTGTFGVIQTFKTSNLKITSDNEISWTLDGEDGGTHKEVNILNHKQALTLRI